MEIFPIPQKAFFLFSDLFLLALLVMVEELEMGNVEDLRFQQGHKVVVVVEKPDLTIRMRTSDAVRSGC